MTRPRASDPDRVTTLILVCPLPPNTQNERKHWRVRLKEKKAYWGDLNIRRMMGKLPRPPRRPFDPAHMAVTLYVWNTMDADNAMARLKPLLDWMVAHEYIGDDSPKRLEWDGLPAQEIDRQSQRVEIEIRPATPTDSAVSTEDDAA